MIYSLSSLLIIGFAAPCTILPSSIPKTTMVKDTAAAEYGDFASSEPATELLSDHEPTTARASVPMLILLASPRMPIQMAWAAQWAALGPFLRPLLTPSQMQLLQAIGPLIAMVLAPTIGAMSDRSTHKWGPRRVYMFYAALASAVCWTLMGFTVDLGQAVGDYDDSRTWTVIFCVVFYVWMDVSIMVLDISSTLLIADFAGDRQVTGQALGQIWPMVGGLVVSAYIYFLGMPYESLHEFMGFLALVTMVVVGLVCCVCKHTPRSISDRGTWSSLCGSIVQRLKTMPSQLVVYAAMMFFVVVGWSVYSSTLADFFGSVVYDGDKSFCFAEEGQECSDAQLRYRKGVELVSVTSSRISLVVGVVYLLVLPFIVKKVGAKVVLMAAVVPQALAVVMAICTNVTIDLAILVLQSGTSPTIVVLTVPVIINVMGDSANIGLYVGAVYSVIQLAQLVMMMIGVATIDVSFDSQVLVGAGGAVSCVALVVLVVFCKIKLFSY